MKIEDGLLLGFVVIIVLLIILKNNGVI